MQINRHRFFLSGVPAILLAVLANLSVIGIMFEHNHQMKLYDVLSGIVGHMIVRPIALEVDEQVIVSRYGFLNPNTPTAVYQETESFWREGEKTIADYVPAFVHGTLSASVAWGIWYAFLEFLSRCISWMKRLRKRNHNGECASECAMHEKQSLRLAALYVYLWPCIPSAGGLVLLAYKRFAQDVDYAPGIYSFCLIASAVLLLGNSLILKSVSKWAVMFMAISLLFIFVFQ